MKALKFKQSCQGVYVSGSKALLVRPVGLFGRGLSVDLPLLLTLADPEASASENVAWDASEEAPGFFIFFLLLALWRNHNCWLIYCYLLINISVIKPM